MTVTYNELTPKENQLISNLPASKSELAGALGITKSTVGDHLSSIRSKGVNIELVAGEYVQPKDRGGSGFGSSGAHYVKDEEKRRVHNMVLEATEWLKEDTADLDLNDRNLKHTPGNEDVAIHWTDDHFGAHRTDNHGNDTFNTEIAIERKKETLSSIFTVIDRQRQAGYEFDTAHLILGGDCIDGEGIFEGHAYERDAGLLAQVENVSDLYIDAIQRLSEEFESVQIIAQKGNHGELRGRNYSKNANADEFVYMTLRKRIGDRGLDNVKMTQNCATYFTNFQMRGHWAHLRHGQNSLNHIGTSSGKNRWRGWLGNNPNRQTQVDIAYRGHFHEYSVDYLDGVPIMMSGSICPPGDFEESLSIFGEPTATVHGVSDTRPRTWSFNIDLD